MLASEPIRPFFSVIVPVYNRAALVGRALRSCLSQSFADFEIVVVDDGSSDSSVDVIRSFDDPRIRLVVHERNRGRCPARNTAMAAARGDWYVFFDSDDELLEGALQTMHDEAMSASPEVLMLRFSCVDDHGMVSPDPPYARETLSYERFMGSLEGALRFEALPCSRTSTFPAIAFPEGHAEEGLYHFDLARTGKLATSPAVVRVYHHDAPNQVTRPDYRRALRFAPDAASNVDAVLARHGEALRQHAPALYRNRLREGALQNFLAGHRRKALRYVRDAARLDGVSVKLALITILGLAGRVPLAMSQSLQGILRRTKSRAKR
ncbi:MAG: glycosyltransferase [Acidobacteriota bacterium]|nr:glycosyltransferase [Acidobacteriota bacterium]